MDTATIFNLTFWGATIHASLWWFFGPKWWAKRAMFVFYFTGWYLWFTL